MKSKEKPKLLAPELSEKLDQLKEILLLTDISKPKDSYRLERELLLEHKVGVEIRKMVNALRCSGCEICSGSNGYYWPANVEQLAGGIKYLENKISGSLVPIRALKERLKQRTAPEQFGLGL